MQTSIYYYSATGNSLHVAKSIGERIGNCAVASMSALRNDSKIVAAADRAGLVFPMHYFGLPVMVSQFVNKLDLSSAQYIFAVVTCGNSYFSSALNQLQALLRQRGKELNAGFHVTMISSYIPLSNIPSPEKQVKILAKADAKVGKIAGLILGKSNHVEPEYVKHFCSPIHSYWKRILPQSYLKFSNSPACTSCGGCEKVCQADNIDLSDGRPKWRQGCQECLACLHFCPANSINYGTRTHGRVRYHHPRINVKEITQSKIRD